MWRRCVGVVGLLGVTAGGLVGCASSPTRSAAVPSSTPVVRVTAPPAASPTASPSPTPSPTPSVSATPFVSPADEVGAHDFVVAYFAELNRAYATGDVSRLKPYRLDTCICARSERLILDTYKAGGRIVGVNFEVLGWAWGAHGPAFARTAIKVHVTPGKHELPGKPTVVDPVVDGYYAVDLRRESGGYWAISDIRGKRVT